MMQLAVVVLGDRSVRECPECVDEMPAQFAVVVEEDIGLCAVHTDTKAPENNRKAIGTCGSCGATLCRECLPNPEGICTYCEAYPPNRS